MTRVGITAAGVISALGGGLEKFACALFSGRQAFAPNQKFSGRTTAEISDFEPQHWLGPKGIRVLDRTARLLAVAAQMALMDAELASDGAGSHDQELGLVCGTLFGGVHSIASFDMSGITDGPALVNPMEFPNTVISAPAGQAAIRHRLRAVNSTICAGLPSGLLAIHYAAEFIRLGRSDALLAGGVDELCEESLSAADDGIVPGEGSALLLLESEHTAAARGRTPWWEVCGFGCFQDHPGETGFAADARGAIGSIRQALSDTGIAPHDIACIIASANGNRAGDTMEVRALETVFGSRLPDIPTCAPKAAFGETMGSSGTFCALTAGLSLLKETVPPTPESFCRRTDLPVTSQAVPFVGEYALIDAFGQGGNNAAAVIRLWKN